MLVNNLEIKKIHVVLAAAAALALAALAFVATHGSLGVDLELARYIRRFFGVQVSVNTLAGILNGVAAVIFSGGTLYAAVIAVISPGSIIAAALFALGRARIKRLIQRRGIRGAAKV